jgi:hypothetical protein
MYSHRDMQITAGRAAAPVEVQPLSYALIDQFESYIDAKPRTVKAYISNIRRFALYLHQEGIHSPTRQDILNYRSYLRESVTAVCLRL